jgi:hypothetical protein
VKKTAAAILATFAATAALTIQPAAADTLRYQGAWYSPYDGAFQIVDGSPALSRSVNAGGFRMTDVSGPTLPAGTSFMAWCVDVYHNLNTTSAGSSYTLKSGADFYGAASYKVTDLERLASYVLDNSLLTNGVQSAAFQLAVWEIVNESMRGSQPYSISSIGGDDFRVTSGDLVARTLANSWLGVVNAGSYAIGYSLGVWDGSNATQDLAVFSKVVTPIPEPETYAMLMAGLGLMGFIARRRRKALILGRTA